MLKKHRQNHSSSSKSQHDKENKGEKKTDAKEKAIYNTNCQSLPLKISFATVANASLIHAFCTIILVFNQT